MAAERTVLVRLKANVGDFQRGMVEAGAAVKGLTKEIDTSSDRTAWLAQGILALAPAAITLGAGAVPAIAGIATQMTVTAAAAGTMVLAFHGIGSALTALNNYQVAPTTAHLQALHVAMAKIGPEGAQFVHFLDSIGPQLNDLSNTARAGMFPGVEDGIKHLLNLLPEVKFIVGEIAKGLGTLASEAGKGLAGPKFEAFFSWLARDAKPILLDMGRTVGNLAEGLANMLVAFGPDSRSFSDGMLRMARSFAEWSRSLDTNQSFQHFLDYVHTAGPEALHFLGALIQAATSLIKAWAPVGQVTLPILTELLTIIAKIADTPIGPAVLGIAALASAYGRLRAIGEITNSGVFTKFQSGLIAQTKAANAARPSLDQLGLAFRRNSEQATLARSSIGRYAKGMAPAGLALGAFGALVSGQAAKFHLSNTAALAMAGTMVGPWGAAVGAGVGLVMDLASSHHKAIVSADDLTSTLNQETGALTKNTAAYVANQLQQAGILDQASQLNLSLPLVTKAAMGNKAAFDALKGSLDIYMGATQPGYTAGGANIVDPEQAHAAQALLAAITEVSGATGTAQTKQRQLAAALHFGKNATDAAAKSQHALAVKTQAAQQAASGTAAQFITLGKDVSNAKVSLDKWIHQLAAQARALTEFGNNARTAAEKGLRQGLIAALEAAGPAGALRMKQLANATDSQIKKANGAWLSGQRAIQNYTSVVSNVPNAKLNVDASPALRGINLVANALRNLPLYRRITIETRHTGGHVTYDTGGYTGDGPKMEVRGIVHAGEVVLPQDVVNRDWSMLKARYGYLPGFAEGGYVSGRSYQSATRGSQKLTVDLGDLSVTGTLNTPWGPAQVRGIARAEAHDVVHKEMTAQARHEGAMNV